MQRAIRLLGMVMALWPTAAPAQQLRAPSAYDRAIAAGYKAAITCSARFIGGRTDAQIAADELRGIYTEYDTIVPTLTAQLLPTAVVEVSFDAALPPRRSVYHPGTGCTTLPIGAAAPASLPAYRVLPGPASADPRPWPLGDALPKIAPSPLAPVAVAFEGARYGNAKTTGIVILSGNRLVAERYAPGFGPFTAQRTWSVAKSITGTLVGVAVNAGAIDPARPAPIPAWQSAGDPRRAITLDQLLRMASGLHSDSAGNRTDAVYFGGTTVPEGTFHWPLEATPGTRFRYANNDILLAMYALRVALGEDRYRDFPRTALFDKLGMRHTVAETDWQGNYVSSSQVWTTARDLARFGLFYLNDGVWNGERLLPPGWRRYVTAPSGPQPGAGDFGYGATFWLMNKTPGVPADTFSANGNRGQYVVIVPSRNIVIVRRGEDAGAGFDIATFTADVLAALP